MENNRLSEYRLMWVIVFFDLPTETKLQRKEYAIFRKSLKEDGFTMFQYSIYVRPCASKENADIHIKRVTTIIPNEGKICIMAITDKQFNNIKIFEGPKKSAPLPQAIQLELF